MAQVTIQRSWPDEDDLTICVEVDESFPDAVAECASAAIHTYREALGISVVQPAEDDQ
jgi:hypothetical protein